MHTAICPAIKNDRFCGSLNKYRSERENAFIGKFVIKQCIEPKYNELNMASSQHELTPADVLLFCVLVRILSYSYC